MFAGVLGLVFSLIWITTANRRNGATIVER
jgi:hypothetical protein